jgi:Putative phage tail protein
MTVPFDPTNKGTPTPFIPGVSHIIPNWRVTPAPVPAATLRDSAGTAGNRQQTVAGNGSVIPIIYGQDRVGGQYAAAVVSGSNLWLIVVWCVGPVDSIVSVEMDDVALPSGVVHYPHLGTASQTVDTNFQAMMAGLSLSFTDAMPYTCYSVFKVPDYASRSGFPSFAAVIKGLKVALTDGGTPTWTDNPVQCAADFVTSTRYGMGLTVDWATVATAKTHCDNLIGSPTEKRRTLNLTMENVQPVGSWLETLRAYCGCILNLEAGVVQFIVDTTTASTFTFTSANVVSSSLNLHKRGTLDVPTVMSVRYTNTGVKPYRDETVTIYAAGVLAGTTPWRESQVHLPGINRYSQARREGIERINAFTLSDLTCTFEAFDPALKLQVGDVFALTHPIGLTAKEFRATGVQDLGFGRYGIAGAEYDAAVYTDSVVTVASTPDTTFPTPGVLPDIINLAGDYERFYQLQDGTWTHRVDLAWNMSGGSYPFLSYYEVVFRGTSSGGPALEVRHVVPTAGLLGGWTSPPLWGPGTYYADVTAVSITGARGTTMSRPFVAEGKTAIPGDVPTFTGFEAGGKVYLYWTPAVDLDIYAYELRYGSTGGSFATATRIEQIDALTYAAVGIPEGTWRFYCAAIDSVGQYSASPKTIDLTVTIDSDAFRLDAKVFDTIGSPTLTNMTAYALRDGTTQYITDFGNAISYGYTNTNDATGLWTDDGRGSTVLADPHTSGTSSYVTQWWDMGQDLTGNITATTDYTVITGSASYYLETATAAGYPGTVTQHSGGVAKTTARYVRVRVEATTSSTFRVTSGASVRMDAYPREEQGSVLTSATPGTPVTVTLAFKYTYVKAIQLTVGETGVGHTSAYAVYDNIVLHPTNDNTFDIYAFDGATNNQDDRTVSWVFKGI